MASAAHATIQEARVSMLATPADYAKHAGPTVSTRLAGGLFHNRPIPSNIEARG